MNEEGDDVELAPCSSCRRHVEVSEVRCPFCDATLSSLRAQRFEPASLTRAAIFGAAVAACSTPKSTPTPTEQNVQPVAAQLDASVPPIATTPDAPPDAAVPDAAVVDAGVPIKPKAIRKPPNKPYGAPPARRRLV